MALAASKTPGVAPRLPLVGMAIAFGLFALLAVLVKFVGMPYFSFDLALSQAIQGLPWPDGFAPFMRGVSVAGDDLLLATLPVVAAVSILAICGARREAFLLLLAIGAEQGIKISVKFLVARPRPTPALVNVLIHAHEEYSFPSGHTVHYIVFFGFLWYLVYRLVRAKALRWPLLVVLGGLVALVGLSRVYLGAHWPTDILGGYLLGGGVLTGTICLRQWWTRRANTASDPVRSDH
jgi:undecaprenyl-diphosphatase